MGLIVGDVQRPDISYFFARRVIKTAPDETNQSKCNQYESKCSSHGQFNIPFASGINLYGKTRPGSPIDAVYLSSTFSTCPTFF